MVATEAKHLTVDEVAALYRVTGQTVVRWQREGKLPAAVRVGRRWLFPAAEIMAHLEHVRQDDSGPAHSGSVRPGGIP